MFALTSGYTKIPVPEYRQRIANPPISHLTISDDTHENWSNRVSTRNTVNNNVRLSIWQAFPWRSAPSPFALGTPTLDGREQPFQTCPLVVHINTVPLPRLLVESLTNSITFPGWSAVSYPVLSLLVFQLACLQLHWAYCVRCRLPDISCFYWTQSLSSVLYNSWFYLAQLATH